MKQCIFCRSELVKNRAKEHVISRTLLKKIDLSAAITSGSKFSGAKRIEANSPRPFSSFVSGDVCSKCNNGWMNKLDLSVEHILLDAYNGTFDPSELSEHEKFALTRYLFKTAISFVGTEPKERRHIPAEVAVNLCNDDYLPNGFLSFMSRVNVDGPTLWLSRLDLWLTRGTIQNISKSQSNRIKFGIQFNSIIFGICGIFDTEPRYGITIGVHDPLLCKGALYNYHSDIAHIGRSIDLVSKDLEYILAAVTIDAPNGLIFGNT